MAIALFRRFALGTALAALALALNAFVTSLADTGALQAIVRLAILAAIAFGLWQALTRSGVAGPQRLVALIVVIVPLLVWQSVIWWLAAVGTFRPDIGNARLLPVAIILPLLIGLPLLLRVRTLGTWLDHTPADWLVALQVYRVFGGVFVVGWATGVLPGIFALPAGLGDMLVGLLALPVALAVQKGGRAWGIAWNVLGILDLVDAVTLGAITSPGPLQLIVPDRLSVIGFYPLVLIPAFAVPLSILLHALSLRQLRRQAGAAVVSRRAERPATRLTWLQG